MTIQALMWGRFISLPAILIATAAGACIPATTPRIKAADLALAEPRFKSAPPEEIIGFAPEPGAKRTFAIAELERIAKRFSLPVEGLQEICVEVPQRQLTEIELREAMRSELPGQAELVILEAPKGPQPIGKLTFPKTGLEPPTQDGSQLWRGHIQYAETKKANLWARVRVTQKIETVIARRDLPANSIIPRDALYLETRSVPLTKEQPAQSLDQVAGKAAKSSIKAGTSIALASLEATPSVKRGDAVKVEVQSGTTVLLFEAVAERQGRDGEIIELRNPSSGKLFRARLRGAKAVISL